jgi:hypothetical protein
MNNPPEFEHMSDSQSQPATRRGTVGTTQRKKENLRKKVPGWPGYIRDGVWIIEKRVGGKKFHVSTRATSPRAAMKQLERFEADPNGFSAAGTKRVAELALTTELIDDFHAWHKTHVTTQWADDVYRTLQRWANHLGGIDLRNLSLVDDLKPFIVGAKSRPLKVASIKVLFRWLRTEKGLVTRAQDVTLDFITPPFKPRKDTGESKAIEFERLAKVVPLLALHIRDVLELLAATGWHISEVRRFANPEIGRFRYRDAADKPEVLATIGTRHKVGGKWHFTALLFQSHVDAAQRIRERGKVVDRTILRRHLKRACEKAGVKAFNMGDMRASVLTWLRLAGVPPALAAAYVGHTSTATQDRFYVNQEIARAVLPRGALRVVEGGKTG